MIKICVRPRKSIIPELFPSDGIPGKKKQSIAQNHLGTNLILSQTKFPNVLCPFVFFSLSLFFSNQWKSGEQVVD